MKNWVEVILVSVGQRNQGLRKELDEKIEETQVGLQVVK
jgi:uncharacterized protein